MTCSTPTEHSPNFSEHSDLQKLDTSYSYSLLNVTLRSNGALSARLATQFTTLFTRPAGEGRTFRIIAQKAALKRVRKLSSDAGH